MRGVRCTVQQTHFQQQISLGIGRMAKCVWSMIMSKCRKPQWKKTGIRFYDWWDAEGFLCYFYYPFSNHLLLFSSDEQDVRVVSMFDHLPMRHQFPSSARSFARARAQAKLSYHAFQTSLHFFLPASFVWKCNHPAACGMILAPIQLLHSIDPSRLLISISIIILK